MILVCSDLASAGPLAFFSFALATGFQGLLYAGKLEATGGQFSLMVGTCIGGMLMIISGLVEFLRRNVVGATMFTLFGAFWFTTQGYTILLSNGTFAYGIDTFPKALQAILCGLGIITFVVASIVALMSVAMSLATLFLSLYLFVLAGAQTSTNPDVLKAAGWMGFITGLIALYVGFGMLLEEGLGKEMLPMLYSKLYKTHATMLYPRLSLHDPLSVAPGVPYEGRPELFKGDNVAALQQPSLADLNRIHAEQV